MFCYQCGTENHPEARFCQNCGSALSGAAVQSTTDFQPQVTDAAIWNPNAAGNWSLVFSPAFGSYLQMLNWRTLGEPEKAAKSQNWFYFSLVMLVVYVFIGLLGVIVGVSADTAVRGLSFLFLLVWYFSAGREQGVYVKRKFGSTYARKPWSKPLLIGVAALFGYIFAAAIAGFVVGVAQSV